MSRTTLEYGQIPSYAEMAAHIKAGLTDHQIAKLYGRQRTWAGKVRRHYRLPAVTAGRPSKDFTKKFWNRFNPPEPITPRTPVRPPSLHGLDEECLKWLSEGNEITRQEPAPWPEGPIPVRSKTNGGGKVAPRGA